MNPHCTTSELLAVRDGEGTAGAADHLADCTVCQRELEMLNQRAAAMRALATRRPPRDRWPVVKAQLLADRRRERLKQAGWATLAVAASLTLAIGVRTIDLKPTDNRPAAALAQQANAELTQLRQQSQQLEATLRDWNPRGRVLSGRSASVIAELEDRIGAVDMGITRATTGSAEQRQLITLWRDRVQLMDALVNAHVSRATYVGF